VPGPCAWAVTCEFAGQIGPSDSPETIPDLGHRRLLGPGQRPAASRRPRARWSLLVPESCHPHLIWDSCSGTWPGRRAMSAAPGQSRPTRRCGPEDHLREAVVRKAGAVIPAGPGKQWVACRIPQNQTCEVGYTHRLVGTPDCRFCVAQTAARHTALRARTAARRALIWPGLLGRRRSCLQGFHDRMAYVARIFIQAT